MPPFKNHVSVVLTLLFSFSESLSRTGSHYALLFPWQPFEVFKVVPRYFSTKPKTKDTVQMAIMLAFNERANTKIAVNTYLRLTPNGIYVGWA